MTIEEIYRLGYDPDRVPANLGRGDAKPGGWRADLSEWRKWRLGEKLACQVDGCKVKYAEDARVGGKWVRVCGYCREKVRSLRSRDRSEGQGVS